MASWLEKKFLEDEGVERHFTLFHLDTVALAVSTYLL